MGPAEVDLRAITRGTVTAPAGCGKTQLIAHTLAGHRGAKPILVLTHTNAGVAALRGRLDREGVPHSAYRLSTIDGWAIRLIASFPVRSGHDPEILRLTAPARDYPAIREAAWKLLQAGHISEVLKASYAHLIVDEYQDCSVPQHSIVYLLSLILPTCVLGDPMQAIFGFRGNALADWNQQVCAHFPVVAELSTPWRWRNAGAEALGQWLLEARRLLAAGQQVDLRTGPSAHLSWIQTVPPNDHPQRLVAARTLPPTPDGRVLLIADSRNRAAQQNFASQTPGASTVEAVDLQDLIAFGSSFDVTSTHALDHLLGLAQSVMTNVGVPELMRRLDSLVRGTARNPPSVAETCALAFQRTPSIATAASLLSELRAMPNVRVHRPAILYSVLKALRDAAPGTVPLAEAARRVREENRMLGRPLPKRAVGSTLLLKGLEAEVAVVLNTDGMSAQHLYVAMTRGSMRLVVCSGTPTIG
ncbi:AAA family ATPase [Pseudomonas aeruginosa]|uniref:UvrD-helicase domain-containing protein n=1 Tax=Gammaproteobacteria TaxID=1236 RepID=UPI001232A750|nr:MULTISPECIES: UvrD-helicase domain-containing protein [Gammaproteobacteria]HBT5887539.1 UvrD-helicase domain-containing protein [Klebsiella quasipneumoniae]HCI6318447.1 UvrD-helicase domain-containing protein [Klebsiella quasipneumoniae subsp. similipneumoniae]KAA5629621.1 AAA family ATPase [Pseudomonas aeruginosa]MBN9702784.1 UvrD-helicase domain-containing protein [Enterobacter roggenkampii]HBN8507719.1 UvrD-helicase domain-containing protein [Pseudomonas aeruginosa]